MKGAQQWFPLGQITFHVPKRGSNLSVHGSYLVFLASRGVLTFTQVSIQGKILKMHFHMGRALELQGMITSRSGYNKLEVLALYDLVT